MRLVTSIKTTIPLAFNVVFSNPVYIGIATAVFTIFWVIFNVFDQLLFFSPVVTFYLPEDAVTGFIITNVTSVLMGILVAMNIYVIRNSKIKLDKSLFSGSILGVATSACHIDIWRIWHICNRFSYKLSNSLKDSINNEKGSPLLMPILKLSYNEIISESKIKILKAIDEAAGGYIESLEQLESISGYGKPLLSYHIQGGKDSKGLADLGLIEIEKGERGKISARLTPLGKLLVIGPTRAQTS